MGMLSKSDKEEVSGNDKLYREILKQEIVSKVTAKINNNDKSVLKTIKSLLDEDEENENSGEDKKK